MVIKDIPRKLIYFQIIYNCVIKFLITDVHLPSALNYVTDIITVVLLYFVFEEHSEKVTVGGNKGVVTAVFLLLVGTFSALLSLEWSPVLYLWSLRNNFRLFVFFYCCCKILDKDDIKNLMELLLAFMYANIIVCIYEYFVKGVEYDYLGGLFGNGVEGGNGPLNALLIISAAYLIISYLNKEKPLWQVVFGLGGCLFIATVGELKIFYFELVLLIALVFIFVKKDYRMALFIVAISVIGVIGMSYYVKLYPNRAGFLSYAFVREYSLKASYGVSSEVNRLTAIPKIWSDYFDGNLKKVLIGIGMGNGELSSQHGFLTSRFYQLNGGRLRYDWFTQAFLFVEFGLTGLILYVAFFMDSCIKALKEKNAFYQFALIANLFIILMVFYNQSLRIESFCYTAAFIAAIPYITEREKCLV